MNKLELRFDCTHHDDLSDTLLSLSDVAQQGCKELRNICSHVFCLQQTAVDVEGHYPVQLKLFTQDKLSAKILSVASIQ